MLLNAHSPAAGNAHECYDICLIEGVNPAIALAFFLKESTYGTKGIAVRTKNWGNVRTPETVGVGTIINTPRGQFVQYSSWVVSLADWCKRLKGPKYRGLTTVEQVVPRYAPSSDGNNVTRYIDVVHAAVNAWKGT